MQCIMTGAEITSSAHKLLHSNPWSLVRIDCVLIAAPCSTAQYSPQRPASLLCACFALMQGQQAGTLLLPSSWMAHHHGLRDQHSSISR